MSDAIQRFIDSGQAEAMDPQELLTWALKTFAPKIALSCSFGAPEGLVLLDMMHRIDPASRVFVLDTGRLPQATYDLIDRVRDRYDKHDRGDLPGGLRRGGDGAQQGHEPVLRVDREPPALLPDPQGRAAEALPRRARRLGDRPAARPGRDARGHREGPHRRRCTAAS